MQRQYDRKQKLLQRPAKRNSTTAKLQKFFEDLPVDVVPAAYAAVCRNADGIAHKSENWFMYVPNRRATVWHRW
jgi:hypothetical protein